MPTPDIFTAQRLTYIGWRHNLRMHLELAHLKRSTVVFAAQRKSQLRFIGVEHSSRHDFYDVLPPNCAQFFCISYWRGTAMRTLSGIVP